jgi:carbon-monoxide dehydrogenase medium subunit
LARDIHYANSLVDLAFTAVWPPKRGFGPDGRCTDAAVALTNVGDMALLAPAAADAIRGTRVDAAALAAAAEAAMAASSPAADLRGSVEYRTAMAGQMTRQAIAAALSRAAGS